MLLDIVCEDRDYDGMIFKYTITDTDFVCTVISESPSGSIDRGCAVVKAYEKQGYTEEQVSKALLRFFLMRVEQKSNTLVEIIQHYQNEHPSIWDKYGSHIQPILVFM